MFRSASVEERLTGSSANQAVARRQSRCRSCATCHPTPSSRAARFSSMARTSSRRVNRPSASGGATASASSTHILGIVARICERVGVLYAGRLVEEGQAAELFKDPRHPSTHGLLRCAPRFGMHKSKDRLDPIPGSLPPLGADIPGCVYADRCSIARDRCREDPPQLETVGDGHLSRCHYPQEVPG